MKPLVLFYLLVIYVLLQFSWWAWLLIELNREVYEQKIELISLSESGIYDEQVTRLETKLKERWQMVAGEGVVFLAILVFGIYKTKEAFRKEFALARQQKNFLLSITHEFKSPLAAVKLNLQTLQKRELKKELQETILNRAISETDRINNLIENALLAARIESSSFKLLKEEFNLTECIASTIQSKIIPGDERSKIISKLEDDVYMKGDALAISSLLLNLVENAEKYSPENTPIVVRLFRERKLAVITVEDAGTGIADTEKVKIFEKFYRVGNEETRNTKGTGLGLFIVKHIVDFHNGEIKVTDNTPSGTIFKVTLPIDNVS